MNTLTRNLLIGAGAIVLVLFCFLISKDTEEKIVLVQGNSEEIQEIMGPRPLVVTATARATASPDIAHLQIRIQSTDAKISTAQKDNEERVQKIFAFLEEQGIEKKHIKTANYRVIPETISYNQLQRYNRQDIIEEVFDGTRSPEDLIPKTAYYTITNDIHIQFEDFSKISAALSFATEESNAQIQNLSFAIEEYQVLRDKAYAQAAEVARHRASIIADSLEVQIGEIENISLGNNMPYYNYRQVNAMENTQVSFDFADQESFSEASDFINSGEIEASVSLTVSFEIQNECNSANKT